MANPDVILAFIGQAGSGKSTSINYFANYFAGTGYTEEKEFSDVFVVIPNQLFPKAINGYNNSERNIANNWESQTADCNQYDFVQKGHQNLRVKVVDTPGFNDTEMERDDENIQKIIKGFADLPFISAVIITINGTNPRLSIAIKTTLSQLRGSLPDSLFNNLFFVFTNCDETTRTFPLELIAEFKPRPERMFHMQNSLFTAKNKSDIDTIRKKKRVAENWQDSINTINDLMVEVSRTAATSTQVFTDMRIKREQLLANKANLIVKQKSLLNIMHQLNIESDRLRNAQTSQAANQNYTQQKNIEKVEIEKKSYFSTVCNESRHGIMQICHENCGLGYQPTLNFDHFKNCAASDGQNCRHCRCSMAKHYHTYEIPVKRQTTTAEIIQSMKAAYDQATQQLSASQYQLQALYQARNNLQADANACKQGILDSLRQLKNICSHYNFPEEMAATIEKLRQEAKIAQDLNSKAEFNNTADAIENLLKQLTVQS